MPLVAATFTFSFDIMRSKHRSVLAPFGRGAWHSVTSSKSKLLKTSSWVKCKTRDKTSATALALPRPAKSKATKSSAAATASRLKKQCLAKLIMTGNARQTNTEPQSNSRCSFQAEGDSAGNMSQVTCHTILSDLVSHFILSSCSS